MTGCRPSDVFAANVQVIASREFVRSVVPRWLYAAATWREAVLTGTKSRREFFAGGLIGLFGLVAVLEGRRLGVGTLSEMGPGFVPMALGVVLCGLGLIIALTGQSASPEDTAEPDIPDPRGTVCILLAAVSFILLGQHVGLAAAIFGSVFIAAMGDRTTKPGAALMLAGGVTVFGCVLFGNILKIPIPLYGWR